MRLPIVIRWAGRRHAAMALPRCSPGPSSP